MTCKATHFNSAAGVLIETWSGLDKSSGPSNLICSIDDSTDAHHFIEVTNVKTYSRAVHVRGIIDNQNNKVMFDGPNTKSQQEWREATTLYGVPTLDSATFSEGMKKISKGKEAIRVEVKYQDLWNAGRLKDADDPHRPLLFNIELI